MFFKKLGIDEPHTVEMVEEAKPYVKCCNDHVRFKGSPPISAGARNKRLPDTIENSGSVVLGGPSFQGGGVQAETTGTGAGVGAGNAQHMPVTTEANGAVPVAGGVAADPYQQRPPRETQLAMPLRDSVLLGPIVGSRIQASVPTTAFTLEQLHNENGTDLASRFPQFHTLMPQIQNQFDLVAQLSTILYAELEGALEELMKVETMAQRFNSIAPDIIDVSFKLEWALDSFTQQMARAVECGIGEDAAAAAAAAAGPAPENSAEDIAEEQLPSAAPSAAPVRTSNSIHLLTGNGYCGMKISVIRIDVEDSSIPLEKDNTSGENVALPVGKYFLLQELMLFFGTKDVPNEPPFDTWKRWCKSGSRLGKQSFTIKKKSLENCTGYVDNMENTVRAGNAGKLSLLPADVVQHFCNGEFVKLSEDGHVPQQLDCEENENRDEEEVGRGQGSAAADDQEAMIGEDENDDMDCDIVHLSSNRNLFEASTGSLAWTVKDVLAPCETAGDGENLEQDEDLANNSPQRDSEMFQDIDEPEEENRVESIALPAQ
jgi:hypothetical protein